MLRIPSELRVLRQWVVWKLEPHPKSGKLTKVPYNARTDALASTTRPGTWSKFTDAIQAAAKKGYSGIGFVFTPGDPYCGIDLDHALGEDGKLAPWAQKRVDALRSYTETSPSGTGVHVIARAVLAGKGRKRAGPDGAAIEVYDRSRFFCMTGRSVDPPAPIRDCQAEVEALYKAIAASTNGTKKPKDNAPGPQTTTPPGGAHPTGPLSDDEVLRRAREAANGTKFAALWAGSWQGTYGSQSEADLALCSLLAFWTGPDAARVDSLFRQSGLYRGKWDELHGEATYGASTIAKCFELRTEYYDPDKARVAGSGSPAAASTQRGDPWLSNVDLEQYEDDEGNPKTRILARTVHEIVTDLWRDTHDWPRVVQEKLLFVPRRGAPVGEPAVRYLSGHEELFAWTQERGAIDWRDRQCSNATAVRRAEVYSTLRERSKYRYVAAETLPHHPPIAGVYYPEIDLPDGTGEALDAFVAHLNPETAEDEQLLRAMIVTPGWGGPPGGRPAFCLVSDYGRGSGKSWSCTAIADVWGGAVSANLQDRNDISALRSRLLDDASLAKRVTFLDNLKGTASCAILEALITAKVIDGKRMYLGQCERPNHMTVFLTANSPALSNDLADRSIVIKIGPPKAAVDFASWSTRFVAANRARLVADALAFLRRPPVGTIQPENRDRWQAWQDAVLARFHNADRLAALIRERRPTVDADTSEAVDVVTAVRELLEGAHRVTGPMTSVGHEWPHRMKDDEGNLLLELVRAAIPAKVLRRKLGDVWGERGITDRALNARLASILTLPPLRPLTRDPSRAHGRNWLWFGDLARPDDPIERDLTWPEWQQAEERRP